MHDAAPVNPTVYELRRAVQACREENWWLGLQLLSRLGARLGEGAELPGYYFSYLGLAVARCQGKKREGLVLCRRAARQQPLQPENHMNLAAVYLLLRKRRAAVRTTLRGLAVDPDHAGLRELAHRLGVRRRPPFPFLPRSNRLNRWVGMMTYRQR